MDLSLDLERLGWEHGDAKVVFDIGANVGEFTAEILASFPKTRIHVFEPDPRAFDELKQRQNSIQNQMVAINSAVGDISGRVTIHLNEDPKLNSIRPSAYQTETTISCAEVAIQRLDEYILRKNLDRIDLIKIDVEGFELQVLEASATGGRPSRLS